MKLPTYRLWIALCFAALPNSAQATSLFNVNLIFGLGLTGSQQAIFTTAASTWMDLLPEYAAGISITSLDIAASGVAIDGPGGILGQAGPDATTTQGGFVLSTHGVMEFDTADLSSMESSGTLDDVLLHEMAHVMGFGTLWDVNNVYDGSGGYTGVNALLAYRAEFALPLATSVPVELGGGPGTAHAHWREVDFGNELMTGFLDDPTFISATTAHSFVDLGYLTVPEPGTVFLAGFVLVALAIRRRITA